MAAGRIEDVHGHCYHPTLGVSSNGLMTIEYTYSSATDPQEIRRVRFDSSHTQVSSTVLRTGPNEGFAGSRWAFYSDLQFDPAIGLGTCNWLWSTHTLVDEGATSLSEIRDVWLFRQNQSNPCFSTDLNADGIVDPFDLMLYSEYYIAGDERADTNADGVVDAVDMANFLNAYQEATGP